MRKKIMIDIYYNPKTGLTLPDDHILLHCKNVVHKIEHVEEVGSELFFTAYRYAMKTEGIDHNNIRFHFKNDEGDKNTLTLCEGYSMICPEEEKYIS